MSILNRVNEIDFLRGFTTWHGKWLVKTHWFLDDKSTSNADDEHSFVVGDGYIRWQMRMVKRLEDNVVLFGFQKRDGAIFPIIFRILIYVDDRGEIKRECALKLFDKNLLGCEVSLTDLREYAHQGLHFHCWIDFPKPNPSDQNRISRPAVSRRLFKSVPIDGGGDEGSGDSGADVLLSTMQIGSQSRKFWCHRDILADRSPVFGCMFDGNTWREGATNNGESVVEIPDIDAETMEAVLNYIYTGTMPTFADPVDSEIVVKIIYAANKYGLEPLKNWCESALVLLAATKENRLEQLQLADVYQLRQLKAVCVAQLCWDLPFVYQESLAGRITKEMATEIIGASEAKQFTITKEEEFVG